eukprot:IDg18226t1
MNLECTSYRAGTCLKSKFESSPRDSVTCVGSETDASVVSLATVRVFLSIAATFDLECDQMDLITAFLNGDLEEDNYMQVTCGFKDKAKHNLV